MAKANITVGVYAGIISGFVGGNGGILLRRRTETSSIIPGKSFKGCWELPGGGIRETEEKEISYHYAVTELIREVIEELGVVKVYIKPTPAFYPVMFKGPAGYDLAMVTVINTSDIVHEGPIKADCAFASPQEVNEEAKNFVAADKQKGIDGKGLLSGYGKRMHCMALLALSHSSNPEYARQASETLAEIQKQWR